VDVDGNPRCRSAEAAHASAGQPDVPLREELAEAVELVLPRLGVEHTVVEVRVQRRDAGLCARRADSAVPERAVGQSVSLDCRRVRLDPDPRRHANLPALDEEIQVRMHVEEDELVRLGRQAGLARERHRIRRRWPRWSGTRPERSDGDQYGQPSHRGNPMRGTLGLSQKEDEMTELASPPVEREQDLKRISHWIGGRLVEGESGRSGPVYNPARGIQTGVVDFATAEEVDRAVQAAKEAFPAWRAMSLSRRTAIFFRIRDLVDQRREEIGRILTAEHGKVLSDAMGEVARGLEVVEYSCGIPELLKGGFTEQASTGIDVYSIR